MRLQYNFVVINKSLTSLREGDNHLLVYTEACGKGLDIGDVERVIHWKATKLLNLPTFFQRAGRAGRIGSNQTVAILYHQESLGDLQGAYEIFRSDIEGPRGQALMSAIRTFDFGSDEAAAVRYGKSSTKNFLKNKGIAVGKQVEHVTDETEGPDARKVICRGILSYIGTQGCMRSIFLKYLDSQVHSERHVDRCCYSCTLTGNVELQHDIQRLLPDPGCGGAGDTEDAEQPPECSQIPHTQNNNTSTKHKETTPEHALAVTTFLRALRQNILRSQWPQDDDSKYSVTPASFFLSDKEIARIAKSAHLVNDELQLAKRLTQRSNYQWAPIAPYAADVITQITQALDSIPFPIDAPRRRQTRQKLTHPVQISHTLTTVQPLPVSIE